MKTNAHTDFFPAPMWKLRQQKIARPFLFKLQAEVRAYPKSNIDFGGYKIFCLALLSSWALLWYTQVNQLSFSFWIVQCTQLTSFFLNVYKNSVFAQAFLQKRFILLLASYKRVSLWSEMQYIYFFSWKDMLLSCLTTCYYSSFSWCSLGSLCNIYFFAGSFSCTFFLMHTIITAEYFAHGGCY